MKTRCRLLILAFAFIVVSQQARAGSTRTQLDTRNLRTHSLKFTVKATSTTGQATHFVVSIEPDGKERTLSPFRSAQLNVRDGKMQIVSCGVAPSSRKKGIAYQFTVSSKYLDKSTFTFQEYAHYKGKFMPAVDEFWFYLKDLAAPK